MALKQDYILRMIEELINVLVKTLKDEDKEVLVDENNNGSNDNELYISDIIDSKK